MTESTGDKKYPDKNSRHFNTDHLKADLKRKSVRSGTVTMASQSLRFIINMASTMILARLLVPADFGLLAMTQSLLVFINLFQSLGLSVATVQREHITHDQVSTLYWVNAAASSAVGLITIALAPLVAMLYNEPRLTNVTMALAIPMIISGLGSQHGALLARQMRFATEQAITVFAMVVSSIVAVVFAKLGHGYWSLVYKEIAMASTIVLCFWITVRWVPGPPRRSTGVRNMLSFGAYLTGSSFVNQMSRNVDNILIGTFAGPTALGLYNRAYNLLMLPIRQINKPVGSVAIPSLSRLQNEPDRFAAFYYKGVEVLLFCAMPIVAFSFVAAEEIVLVVLGDQWKDTVEIFRALAPAAILGTYNMAQGWLFAPLGKTKQELYVTVVSSTLTVGAFAVGINWGAIGVAYAYSSVCMLKTIPEVYYATRNSPVTFGGALKVALRPITACFTAGIIVLISKPYINNFTTLTINLIVLFLVFTLGYLASIIILPGGRHFLLSTKKTLFDSFLRKSRNPK